LPAPAVFSFGFTNNAGLMETNYEGLYVMLTNVYFPSDGTATYPNGNTVTVTNGSGAPFTLFISSQCQNVVGQPIPRFAYSVLGTLTQSKSGAYSSAGYELNLTAPEDVITAAPPAVAVSAALNANGHVVLNWTAVPYNYSYSVLGATSLSGPWAPVASGLTFTTAAGSYMDASALGTAKFYRVVSP